MIDLTWLGVMLVVVIYFCFGAIRRTKSIRVVGVLSAVLVLSLSYNPSVSSDLYRDSALVLAGSFLLLSLFSKHEKGQPKTVAVLVVVWYIGFAAVTFAQLPSNLGSLAKFGLLSVLLVIVGSRISPIEVTAIFRGLISIGTLHVLLGATEFATKSPLIWGYNSFADGSLARYANPFFGGQVYRIQSTMGHPIPLGVLIAVALILLVASRREFGGFYKFFCGAVLLGGLFLNGSRGALVAVVCGLLYLMFFAGSSRSKGRNLILLGLTGCVVLLADLGLRTLVGDFVESGSYTNRLGALEAVPGLMSRNSMDVLFGAGFGSENLLFNEGYLQQNGFNIVDNQLVTTLATYGIFGVGILVTMTLVAFVRAKPTVKAVLVLMVAMMFSFDYFRWPETFSLFFLFLGLSACGRSIRRRRRMPAVTVHQPARLHTGLYG